jgi:hypothetical protein
MSNDHRPLGVYDVVRAFVGIDTGRRCRRCADPIGRGDALGFSEAVCRVCR